MATTTTIRASVKISPKIRDTFYSIEYSEERQLLPDEDVTAERSKLFDDVYNEVVDQINSIIDG